MSFALVRRYPGPRGHRAALFLLCLTLVLSLALSQVAAGGTATTSAAALRD
jgi:hypothetical protein